MSVIFFRYVLREVASSFALVTSVLLVILMTNQLAFVLARAAARQIPASAVPELLWLAVQQNIVILLPVGLVLAIVLALGRLYHDSELAAAQACGLGTGALVGPVLLLTLLVAAFGAQLSFELAPRAAARTFELRQEALRTAEFRQLASGQFRGLGDDAVLYFRASDADGTLRDVFFQRRTDTRGLVQVVVADRARYALLPDGTAYIVTLYDGERYEGIPGQATFRMVRFREQSIPVRLPEGHSLPERTDLKPTATLLASASPKDRAELQWRIATPVMVLILGLLGVPLARLRPRQGRYARVIYVVILYFIYANLLTAGQVWITRRDTPAWLGLWWVHGLVIVLAAVFLWMPDAITRVRYRRRQAKLMSPRFT
jgi:lipopolysaccharide export system permease protein